MDSKEGPTRQQRAPQIMVVRAPEEERCGVIADFHFEPAEGWKPGPMNPEKERIKQFCQLVYECATRTLRQSSKL